MTGVFAAASEHLRRLVPFDAAVWLASDPATGLPTAPTRIENFGHLGIEGCRQGWALEFTVDDVNLYRRLAAATTPAAGLRLATDDRPTRSPRFTELVDPNGFDDELRGVLRVDGNPWAMVALFRSDGSPPFGSDEIDLVASLSAPLASAVRRQARPGAQGRAAVDDHPGMMLFAADGVLISADEPARAWLDELTGEESDTGGLEVPLPMVVVSMLMRAQASADQDGRAVATARVRSAATGRWFSCYASCLRDTDGQIDHTALVVEPANAAVIAPLFAEAYELSPREQQIVRLLARGRGTSEIAEQLQLSRHTVRDHIKAVFNKVGVSSRGELVATLFSQGYEPSHLDPGAIDQVGD